jgi:D-sedoheptulose 7-phosphate isomerase
MDDAKRGPADAGKTDAESRVRAILDESARVKRALGAEAAGAIAAAASIVVDVFRAGGKLLLLGNGGSAADAQHLASEFTGRFQLERQPLPALALSANTSDLTAIGNDYGYEHVFGRLVAAYGRKGDAVLAISTSGNSPNVLEAVREARQCGLRTIGLTGRGGGKLAPAVDVAVVVPSDDTQRIQESHIAVGHIVCELVEQALFAPHRS